MYVFTNLYMPFLDTYGNVYAIHAVIGSVRHRTIGLRQISESKERM